ncbi:MAG: tyrosine-type recombinase/integrase [Polynucleobacter sp.]|uniref:tyrosine-type recombinase/integrase n=1 Tax=Polynucleobacter sp. TaxID=2029855 RepID=UPI00271BC436|nr:tyrosine-type recombinase/integrase [Polynucleobacter sp.]MDO8715118.1 tyrosine-type recombinase/integrase [Polynucleobacter sp.]
MSIVMISEPLLKKATATDGRILRDRVLSGFGVRLNARKRTFLIATSVSGKQFRMMLGHWPLMSVDEARSHAMDVLRQCRNGDRPSRKVQTEAPTLRAAMVDYCTTKGIKASSQRRYDSILRTHFQNWMDCSVKELGSAEFSEHCHAFARSKGAALVEVGRGVITALIKYVNAVHGLALESPFTKLAAAGLMPERSQPRARVLQEVDLPTWRAAIDQLGERQRDFLLLTLYTGLRRNECRELTRKQIDLTTGVLSIPDTKNGKPHSLPITPLMREILERRCLGLGPDDQLFKGVSAEHVPEMAMRLGAPRFMLHDLRKLVATVGEKLGLSSAVLRRILNHTAPKSDVLHRHYIGLGAEDVAVPMVGIQDALVGMMRNAHQGV